jgi:cysteine-rich repeat protein
MDANGLITGSPSSAGAFVFDVTVTDSATPAESVTRTTGLVIAPQDGFCGDGIVQAGEQCDDGNTDGTDGCGVTCQLELGFECPTPGAPCVAVCIDRLLVPGWNMIGGAVDLNYDAASLCQEIGADGGSPVEVDRFVNGGWEGHICGLPFNNFLIEPGSGYFVLANGPSTWCQLAASIASPFGISFTSGWNSFSLPAWASGWTAEGLCQEINAQGGSVQEIDRFVNGGWEGHICGLPFNNFTIEPGSGYFALVGTGSTLQLTAGDVPARSVSRRAKGTTAP